MNQTTLPELNEANFDVVIVGAGIAGLSAAQTCSAKGLNVAVLEKSRGPGGRMATRRIDGATFNHGVPSFLIESAAFLTWAREDTRKNLLNMVEVTEFRASSTNYQATTTANASMNLLARSTFAPTNFYTLIRVTTITLTDSGDWRVDYQSETAQGEVTATGNLHTKKVVLALPAPQAAALLAPLALSFAALAKFAADTTYDACWVGMFSVEGPSNIETDAFGKAKFIHPQTQFATCVRQPKIGDSEMENWVVHATTQWTSEHLNDTKEMAGDALFSGFAEHFNIEKTALNCMAHRWLYSQPAASNLASADDAAAFTEAAKRGLFCVGDWVLHPAFTTSMCNVERAWLSGKHVVIT